MHGWTLLKLGGYVVPVVLWEAKLSYAGLCAAICCVCVCGDVSKEKTRIKKPPDNSIISIIRDIDMIIRSHALEKGSEVIVIYKMIPMMSCKHSPGSR